MTDLQEGFLEEDTLVEGDSPEEEPLEEVEDTQEEAHREQDPLEEAVGDPHQSKYHNHKQENWWEKHPPSTTETERTHNFSSTNGSCTGE